MSRAVGLAVGLALLVPAAASASTYVNVLHTDTGGYIQAYGGQNTPTAISLQRAGAVIAANSGTDGAYVDVNPQPGDILTVSVNNQPVLNRTYDGRPSLDASVCGTTTSFTGLRLATSTIDRVGANQPDPAQPDGDPLAYTEGTAANSGDDTYGGTFDKAVGPDWVAWASSTDVAGDVTYNSAVTRTIGDCAPVPAVAPAPVVAPAPDTTAPTGRLMAGLPFRGGIAALLDGHAVSTTMVGEAGVTVTQALYLNDGAKLPARAAATRKPTLLASGRAVSKRAGAVRLKLHATKKVATLRHKRTVRVAIVTTLRDRAGNVKRLPVKRVVLKRS
jgi:hypothetical protein